MQPAHFNLDPKENSRFVRILQAIFGTVCIAIATYWLIFQYGSMTADPTMWITMVFLVLFGAYQIAAGTGATRKYISIEQDKIILKKSSFFPSVTLPADVIRKLEIFPLSICFISKNNKKTVLRFGLNYTEIINPVKDSVTEFAEKNGIVVEEKKEEI